MGAILGRENVVNTIRMHKCVYWKIYETPQKKEAGNYVSSADFENADLGVEQSCDDLRTALQRLAGGRYLLTSYAKPDAKRGGIDTWIELENTGALGAAIGSTGTGSEFVVAGFGKVTPDNLGEYVAKKFDELHAEKAEKERIRKIEEENAALKKELKENDNGFNKGMIAVGSVLYSHMAKTPAFKEVIGIVNDFRKAAKGEEVKGTAAAPQAKPNTGAKMPDNHVEGDMMEIGGVHVPQDEFLQTMDDLAKDDPQILERLKKLAKLKKEEPSSYNDALDMLNAL